jgi:serine/threonine protein kinase
MYDMADTTHSIHSPINFIETLEHHDDTIIYLGTYGSTQCIIKQVLIDPTYGIPSKVLKEVTALKKLSHKNIIKLYDVITGSVIKNSSLIYCSSNIDSVFLVLEKGDMNLYNLSQSNITTPRNILKNISCGLKYINDNGYIHGDLSINNIVAFKKKQSDDFICKIIDFGSATKIYRKSAISIPTIYVAPIEILSKNNDISPLKIDSWSLGCVSYYVTTGELLFSNKIETSKNIINTVKETFKTKKNVNELLMKKSNDVSLNKYVIKLIDLDKNKRINVSTFYNKVFNEENKKNIPKSNNYMYDMFEKSGFSEQNFIRSKLIQLFLACDIKNNISIENIFLTFKLLYKLKQSDENTYMTNAIILFSLTTKLVSPIEISIGDMIYLIKYMTGNDISINDLSTNMFNLLETFNWDIDIESLISYIPKVPKNVKMHYLIISLALLCDRKYDVFTINNLYKMISSLLNCLQNTKITHIENVYDETHLLNDMLESINKMDDTTSMQGKLIKEYLISIDVEYLMEDLKTICLHR